MSKWIAEFDLEEGDTMPEHMDLWYEGERIDYHCRPMWIPCKERLPEIGSDVLVTAWDGKSVFVACINTHGEWVSDDETFIKGYEPIAWMPLPEPYEED